MQEKNYAIVLVLKSLIYHFKDPTTNINFNKVITAATLFDEIKSSRIKISRKKLSKF